MQNDNCRTDFPKCILEIGRFFQNLCLFVLIHTLWLHLILHCTIGLKGYIRLLGNTLSDEWAVGLSG